MKFLICTLSVLFLFCVAANAQPKIETPREREERISAYNRAIGNPENVRGATDFDTAASHATSLFGMTDYQFRKTVLKDEIAVRADVLKVIDGNTITIKAADKELIVRIVGIDAPEVGQNKNKEAADFLSKIILNKKVTLGYSVWRTDPDRVPQVKISSDGKDVGLAMLESGLVWYDEAYEFHLSKSDASLYKAKNKQAVKAAIGIWEEKSPQKPWRYRDEMRRKKKSPSENNR